MTKIGRFEGGDIYDPTYQKSIVDIFLNSVYLYDDYIAITVNWKDGIKTMTFAELEEVLKSIGIEGSYLVESAPC